MVSKTIFFRNLAVAQAGIHRAHKVVRTLDMNPASKHSVNHLVALARHAATSTTYKPALLKALVRLVRRGCGHRLSLTDIGAEFVSLYWTQTVIFRLRQAATISKEPEVVRYIRDAADSSGTRTLNDLPNHVRQRLNAEMARILQIDVLRRFHNKKPADMPELFAWTSGEDAITLAPNALEFIKRDALTVESVANFWWARFLEKTNALAPLIIQKIERDGVQKRAPLSRFLQILQEVDGNRCFYCDRDLAIGSKIHIDHVIPWSFLLADPAWDLALACAPCNLSKSDYLPTRAFIEKLGTRHIRRAAHLHSPMFFSALLLPGELDGYYEAALSVEWPSGWSPAPSTISGAL